MLASFSQSPFTSSSVHVRKGYLNEKWTASYTKSKKRYEIENINFCVCVCVCVCVEPYLQYMQSYSIFIPHPSSAFIVLFCQALSIGMLFFFFFNS